MGKMAVQDPNVLKWAWVRRTHAYWQRNLMMRYDCWTVRTVFGIYSKGMDGSACKSEDGSINWCTDVEPKVVISDTNSGVVYIPGRVSSYLPIVKAKGLSKSDLVLWKNHTPNIHPADE